MLKIGFYLNEINYRGISNSVYLFAKNNEKILKNKSIIFYWARSIDNEKEVINLAVNEVRSAIEESDNLAESIIKRLFKPIEKE